MARRSKHRKRPLRFDMETVPGEGSYGFAPRSGDGSMRGGRYGFGDLGLNDLKAFSKKGRDAIEKMGAAIAEIRDRKLWLQTHPDLDFDAYVKVYVQERHDEYDANPEEAERLLRDALADHDRRALAAASRPSSKRVYNPLVALEKQLELIREAERPDRTGGGLGVISLMAGTEFVSRYFMREPDVAAVKQIAADVHNDISFAPLVRSATPAFISSDMMDIVIESMDSLPDTVTIQPHDLQAQSQFIWFEKPVPLGGSDFARFQAHAQGLLVVDVPEAMRVWWAAYYAKSTNHGDFEHLPPAKAPRVLVYVVGYVVGRDGNGEWSLKMPGRQMRLTDWQFMDVLGWQNWLEQDTIGVNYCYERGRRHFVHRTEDADAIEYAFLNNDVVRETMDVPKDEFVDFVDRVEYRGRQLAAAVIHFMRQRIVRISRYEGTVSRQQKRAAEREGKPPPPTPYVNVVKLRSIDYVGKPRNEGEEGRRHLTERHVRRAHWRNQWYASEQRHKPKLIAAMVVGPEGTPIKGGAKLLAVVR